MQRLLTAAVGTFVALASLQDPALIPSAIAVALDVREAPGVPLLESLTAFLQRRRLLLVLDNCEHVIQACAGLAEKLLCACPHLTLLATSREALNIPGERVFLGGKAVTITRGELLVVG